MCDLACNNQTDGCDCREVVPGEQVGDLSCHGQWISGRCCDCMLSSDCVHPGAVSTPPPSTSRCEYANDGECDEAEYCMPGTDTADCCMDNVPGQVKVYPAGCQVEGCVPGKPVSMTAQCP